MSRYRRFLCLLVIAGVQLSGAMANRATAATSTERRFLFSPIRVKQPYVAVTFDDGPDRELTPKLLDLLAAHHARATFFVIGTKVAEYPELVARAAREGHEIGNHTWWHPRLVDLPDEQVREQLQKTDDAIRAVIGRRPKVMRPPGGAIFERQEAWIRSEFGYATVLWDIHGFDWVRPPPPPAQICSRIVEKIHPGAVILCHDTQPGTLAAMPSILSQLEEKHFEFVTVSELLELGSKTSIAAASATSRAPAARAAPSGPATGPSDGKTSEAATPECRAR
jgi:peptidoglycan/xylan/chitin deacetylase (PgdA/CDA1 family)